MLKYYKNKKYIYELATDNDGEAIAELLEKTSFDGDISLTYAKRPNAVKSVKKESIKYAIVVGREIDTNLIKGVGICTINKMLICGKESKVAYLGGLRVDRDATLNIIEAYKILEDFIKKENVNYTYTTILTDNTYAQKMLTKQRKIMPLYRKISDYTVNIFSKNISFDSHYFCEKVSSYNKSQLIDFINVNTKNKIFFPQIDFENDFFDLNLNDFYILKNQNNEILACGILWEQTDYKQLIIKRYSKKYKILKNLFNTFLNFFNMPKFPNENEVIKYQTLSFVLYKDDNELYLKEFIKQISNFIDYEFFVYGATTPFSGYFAPIKYNSYVYIVDWDKNIDMNKFNNSKIYIECALL